MAGTETLREEPVPDLIKAWRARHGLSQAAAAERLGISLRTLQGWEAGRGPDKSGAALLRIALRHV